MDKDLYEALLGKFPTFDPQWDEMAQRSWFTGFERLLEMAESVDDNHHEPDPTGTLPAAALAPIGVPAVTAPAPGRKRTAAAGRGLSLEQREDLRELAASGASNKAAATATGLPESTVGYYMQQYRREAGTLRRMPFRAGAEAGSGQNGAPTGNASDS